MYIAAMYEECRNEILASYRSGFIASQEQSFITLKAGEYFLLSCEGKDSELYQVQTVAQESSYSPVKNIYYNDDSVPDLVCGNEVFSGCEEEVTRVAANIDGIIHCFGNSEKVIRLNAFPIEKIIDRFNTELLNVRNSHSAPCKTEVELSSIPAAQPVVMKRGDYDFI